MDNRKDLWRDNFCKQVAEDGHTLEALDPENQALEGGVFPLLLEVKPKSVSEHQKIGLSTRKTRL